MSEGPIFLAISFRPCFTYYPPSSSVKNLILGSLCGKMALEGVCEPARCRVREMASHTRGRDRIPGPIHWHERLGDPCYPSERTGLGIQEAIGGESCAGCGLLQSVDARSGPLGLLTMTIALALLSCKGVASHIIGKCDHGATRLITDLIKILPWLARDQRQQEGSLLSLR